ncbi:hypothetical protein J6590_088714, partial [Homalodisca vitripennis]
LRLGVTHEKVQRPVTLRCPSSGSAARDPHGIKQITVGPPHGIKQITMFIRENVECLDSSFTTTTTIKFSLNADPPEMFISFGFWDGAFYI